MKLRMLKEEDAELMHEWMHDDSVVKYLKGNFKKKTLEDCVTFVLNSKNDTTNVHLAICSEEDEYMGTVSLKSIERCEHTAEMAIVLRNKAMGKGYAWFGLFGILKKAFDEYDLQKVYWCVSRDNTRAVRFYDKHAFHETIDIPSDILMNYKNSINLKWYSVCKEDFLRNESVVLES